MCKLGPGNTLHAATTCATLQKRPPKDFPVPRLIQPTLPGYWSTSVLSEAGRKNMCSAGAAATRPMRHKCLCTTLTAYACADRVSGAVHVGQLITGHLSGSKLRHCL